MQSFPHHYTVEAMAAPEGDVSLADDCLRDAHQTTAQPFVQALADGRLVDPTERYHALRLLRRIPDWDEPCMPDGLSVRPLLEQLLSRDSDIKVSLDWCSPLTGMQVGDLTLESNASVRIHGKGRKERSVPLWSGTARQLKYWLRAYPRGHEQPLFPNRSGGRLTRIGLTERLKLAAKRAAQKYPELTKRRIFPHLIRHSIAMHMLQAGVDITVIALWLGHESPATTHRYVEADLAMKERALQTLQAPAQTTLRYHAKDKVLQFLQSL